MEIRGKLSIELTEFIKKRGYICGSYRGERIDQFANLTEISVLIPTDSKIEEYFFGLITRIKYQPDQILCVIWLSNRPRSANNSNWVIEYYGSKNEDEVKQIANDLENNFQVAISLTLVDQDPKFYRAWSSLL